MKKIIKLTESDLTRIVKRVINENNTKTSLIGTIKDEGFKSTSEMVGGAENLMYVMLTPPVKKCLCKSKIICETHIF